MGKYEYINHSSLFLLAFYSKQLRYLTDMSDDVPLFKNHKMVLILSLVIFAFFSLMILSNKLGFDFIILGVIREMLTLPAFLLLAVLIPVVLFSLWKGKQRLFSVPFYSLLILLSCIALILSIR